jgi:hypothetical protein
MPTVLGTSQEAGFVHQTSPKREADDLSWGCAFYDILSHFFNTSHCLTSNYACFHSGVRLRRWLDRKRSQKWNNGVPHR